MKKAILILAGLSLLAGGGFWIWRRNAAQAPAWREARVTRGPLEVKILSSGVVQPENRVEIKPPIAGRVEEVLVREGEKVRKGHTLAWMSSTDRAALIDAARAKGPEELAHWEELYKPAPLVAPLAGTIIARSVEAGQTVTSNDSVYVLSDRLIVKADVDETDIGRLKVGMPARFNLDSHPQRDIDGRVERIAQESKTVSNVTTYQVDVVPDRVPRFMKSGMTANVNFLLDSSRDALRVPAEALRYEAGEAYVMVPNPQDPQSPLKQPVRTGLSDGNFTAVREGLAENDVVLVPLLAGRAEEEQKVNPLGFNRPRRRRS